MAGIKVYKKWPKINKTYKKCQKLHKDAKKFQKFIFKYFFNMKYFQMIGFRQNYIADIFKKLFIFKVHFQ